MPNEILLLIEALISGAAQILAAQKNRTAQNVGNDLQLANQVALTVLQATAQVQGATVDWNDPAQVSAFVATLPVFVPISDPSLPGNTPAKGSG
jgi:threonine/homoserine/homoserine lactone efflux protein